MKILLVKCHKKTIFSRVEPIITEPLELEYLSALLDEKQIEHRIYDPLLEGKSFYKIFEEYQPDILLLSGYITAVDVIIDYAKYGKKKRTDLKVIVGGVHAEVNYEDFFVDAIDFIIHSDGLNTLEALLKANFNPEEINSLKGLAYPTKKGWRVQDKTITTFEDMPLPNRSYFEKYKNKTKYMNYSPVAIVKTALSCPYRCNFCYCKMLNSGSYQAKEIQSVVEEISLIDAPYIWIVDDSFLLDPNRIQGFIDEVKKQQVNKKYILYSRVDFIAKNEDLLEKLAEVGLIEVIVGMEAVEDNLLEGFDKNCTAYENQRAVEILTKHKILLTALFIAGIDFTPKDFRKMRSWIRKMKLQSYTVSIFTPMKGTVGYEDYQEKIEVTDHGKRDFLHLILKPEKMRISHFYFHFYMIYIEQFFRSKFIRNFVMKTLKNIIKGVIGR